MRKSIKINAMQAIESRLAGDELSRKTAMVESLSWAVCTGNVKSIETLMAFLDRRVGKAVDLTVMRAEREKYATAKEWWSALKVLRKDTNELTNAAVHNHFTVLFNYERDKRQMEKLALANAAAAKQPTYHGEPEIGRRETLQLGCDHNIIDVEVVEVVEQLCLPSPSKTHTRPQKAAEAPQVIILGCDTPAKRQRKPRAKKAA